MRWRGVRSSNVPDSILDEERVGHTATLIGGKIYILGGNTLDEGRVHPLFVLDYNKQEWIKVKFDGHLPDYRSYHSASLIDDMIYILGGFDEDLGGVFNSMNLQVYDLSTNEVMRPTTHGSEPSPCFRHTADYFNSRRELIIFGGKNFAQYFNHLHAFKVDSFSWRVLETRGKKPMQRASHMSCTVNEKLVIFGGGIQEDGSNDIHILDTRTLAWSIMPKQGRIPPEMYGATITNIHGKLFIFGGIVRGNYRSYLFVYDFIEAKWSEGISKRKEVYEDSFLVDGGFPPRLARHQALLLKDKLVIIGGTFDPIRTIYVLEFEGGN